MISRLIILLLIIATTLSGAGDSKPEDPGLMVFRDRCMACHLQTGMGIREMNAPSIAGLPRWYVSDQLRKFRRDQRGFHKDDNSGHLMQANAAALDERSIAFVGRYIENLQANTERNTLGTVLSHAAGTLYQQKCAGCHGENAEGKRAERVPPLTSQPDWYLLHQMENFLSGRRIHSDEELPKATPEEVNQIVAWISTQEELR